MRYPALVLSLLLVLAAPATAQDLRQDFALEEGGQEHYFTWTGPGQAHLLNRPDTRLVVAFPADNVGVSLWYGAGSEVHVVAPPQMRAAEVGQRLDVTLRSTKPVWRLEDVVLDSIRTIRDRQTLGPRGAEQVRKAREGFSRGTPRWARETARLQANRLTFERDGYRAILEMPAGVAARQTPQGWEIAGAAPFQVKLTAEVPEAPYRSYAVDELFTPEALALLQGLEAARDPRAARVRSQMQGLLFLATREKFMAGSWRFLTYFGRDTLLSLMLLEPALTQAAYERGLFSVLERLSPAGEVAHEEDLGPWAERRRVEEEPGAADLDAPIYDYKMVDDDFMLAPALARLDPARFASLMNDPANREPVHRNWRYVLDEARRGLDARFGVALRPGLSVGDWRDSNEGLGWGRYPGNVNLDLVPAALEAIGALDTGKFAREARELALRWSAVEERYGVRLSEALVRERLRTFLAGLPEGERAFYLDRGFGAGATTLRAFLEGAPALPQGLRFPALALQEDGKPVEVMNSDLGFRLFLGEPSQTEVEALLPLLELDYPVGLMTGVGPVVANAAYSLDERHRRELGRDAYHGAVVWSWQSLMLRAGLARQKERFPALAARLDAVAQRLAAAEARAGALAGSELWTFAVEGGDWQPVAFGMGTSSSKDESNPVQLWSTVYPAVLLREK